MGNFTIDMWHIGYGAAQEAVKSQAVTPIDMAMLAYAPFILLGLYIAYSIFKKKNPASAVKF